MDDGWKEFKRNKPQQKLYKPGSGPLKKSSYGLDTKMNTYDVNNGPRGRDSQYGSKSSIYEEDLSNNRENAGNRNKKPEQQLYVARSAECKSDDVRQTNTSRCDNNSHSYRRSSNSRYDKHANNTGHSRGPPTRRDGTYVEVKNKNIPNSDVNYNRNYRQVSEPRSMSPSRRIQDTDMADRNRDTRSMDTSAGRHNTTTGVKGQTKQESDSEPVSCSSSNLMDMTNLDWTEEVEKSMKLDDMCDSTASSPTENMKSLSISQDTRSFEHKTEPRETKRSGRLRRRDKRSSSRGHKNDKRNERNRKDGQEVATPTAETKHKERERRDSHKDREHRDTHKDRERRDSHKERERKDSCKERERRDSHKERERRDSHKSNRSSNIGNSRDDLDRWRSLRSFSREQSLEGRIVSQCNSRDTSANRTLSPRDNDGFRIPANVSKNSNWTQVNQKKNNGTWNSGRTSSIDRGRQSPAPSGKGGEVGTEVTGGGSRRTRRRRRGRNSENTAPPAPHPAGSTPAPTNINWREEILESKKYSAQDRLDRNHEVNRNRLNSGQSDKSAVESTSHPGLLILPQSSISHLNKERYCEGAADNQKMLYDHHNPSKPIIVQSNSSKIDTRLDRGSTEWRGRGAGPSAGVGAGPECGEGSGARAARHRLLLQEVDRADAVLHAHLQRSPPALAAAWPQLQDTRRILQNSLQKLLMSDLKYCQSENIEHNFWKILYYNFIEMLRKSLTQVSTEDKPKIVKLINDIIEEGNTYFENLVQMLEKTYKFNTEDYINDNHLLPPKGLGYIGLALISVQKLYIFLGDLARYKEQVNETNNYAKSKFWYTKAQQINPKNGRPYNQLAILAIYARRKLDAVYYYMRSFMSSNPFHSARESLISLFDENRKKYEAAERKRRALEEANAPEEAPGAARGRGRGRGLRREVWVRPGGGRTSTLRRAGDELLANMTPVELNKNFITSYLYVHGKLVTKIGMETFYESAALMLRQFRALLHQQPLPTPAARLLQLTALNMFAVESNIGPKEAEGGARSGWLQCALGVSLLMFGALTERCCALLPEPAASQQHADALLLLPAIKVWTDWMLCHSSVWNPPPSFDSFDLGSDSDPWDWLAKLMNILEAHDDKSIDFETEMKEGYEAVRLPEDGALAGFTPLMYMEPAAAYVRRAPAATPPPLAHHALRLNKLLFFGTEYLVGVEPPVLRVEYPVDAPPRYVSAVQRTQPLHLPLQDLSEDSEEEVEDDIKEPVQESAGLREAEGAEGADEVTQKLLRRKEQLEVRRANMERRRQRMEELVAGGSVVLEVEVRPRWLVPDTNCFIDHLPLLRRILLAEAQPCLLAVPLVVVTELEGLRRCERVGTQAAAALEWLGAGVGAGAGAPAGVRFATSRGSLLASRAFTAERETARSTNDDKVLATALNLHANIASEPDVGAVEAGDGAKCVRRVREVVLLTDDRNLRVKALAAELPTRDLPSFVEWVALHVQEEPTDVKPAAQ